MNKLKRLNKRVLCLLLMSLLLTEQVTPMFNEGNSQVAYAAGGMILENATVENEGGWNPFGGIVEKLAELLGLVDKKANQDTLEQETGNIKTQATENHNATTENIEKTTTQSIQNQQTMLDSIQGAGGYSNTHLMGAISNVNYMTQSIDKYMSAKYIMKDDITYIKLAMYLSQFTKPLEENLLNVITNIKQSQSTDNGVDLSHEIPESISGESAASLTNSDGTPVTIGDLCDYIQKNYYITKLYKSNDGTTYSAATIADLFYDKTAKFYIKDTYYVPQSADFIKENNTPDVSSLTHESAVSTRTALSTVFSGDDKLLLPFLDSSIRKGNSAYELSSINLTVVDTYQCVLSDSLAVQTALTAVLNEYERLNPNFKESNMKDAMGATELGMDSFGNILSYTEGYMVLNAMMNPTLMTTGGNEKVNLAAYSYKRAWADVNPDDFDTVYLTKKSGNLPDIADRSFFASKIFKKTINETDEAYFIWQPKESVKKMPSSTLINGDKNPGWLFKRIKGVDGNEKDLVMFLFRGDSNALKSKNKNIIGKIGSSSFTYTVLHKDNLMFDGALSSFDEHTSKYVVKDGEEYEFTYYTTSNRVASAELPNLSEITAKEIVGLLDIYSTKDTLGYIDMFNQDSWDTYGEVYQELLSNASTNRSEYVSSQGEGYSCLPNSALSIDGDQKVSDVLALGILTNDERMRALDSSITIYPYNWTYKRQTNSVTLNYPDLLFSIFRNTNSNNQQLEDLAEMSEDTINALKEVKAMEILNRIFYKQTNPITTVLKYVAGLLQSWHLSLSSGNLSSLFYIEKDNLGTLFDTLATICFTLALVILVVRTAMLLFKSVISKDITVMSVAKATFVTSLLAICPAVLLYLLINGVAYITDHCTSTASMKYTAVAIEAELQALTDESNNLENEELMYFIENFSEDYANSIEIKKMVEDRYIYDTIKLADILEILDTLPDGQRYGEGDDFVCAFGDHYDESIFYYFLDYYLNVYVDKKEGISLSETGWQDELKNILTQNRGTMKSIYSSRSFVYGETAAMSTSKKALDDVFGLGMLFYTDGSNPDERDFKYPIELLDSEYYNTDYLGGYDNVYWSCILDNQAFHNYNNTKVKNNLIASGYSEEKATVISGQPIYNREVLSHYRTVLTSRNKNIGAIEVKPVILATEIYSKIYNIPVKDFTALEQKLWKINENIHDAIIQYFNLNLTNTHDFTDVIQLAAISTFEFNKVLGVNGDLFDRNQVEPISIEKGKLDLDTIMKSIFNNTSNNSTNYDLMYELVLNQKGVITAILLIIAELVLSLYIVIRMIHLIQIYIMATISFSLAYGWKRNLQNKSWLGLLWQIVYFLGTHTALIWILNLFSNQKLGQNAFVFIFIALGLLVVSVVAVGIELAMVIFVLKHWKDLGGQLVADKLHAVINKLSANIEDGVDAENASIENASSEGTKISNMDTDGDGRDDIEQVVESNVQALNNEEAEAATPRLPGIGNSGGSRSGNNSQQGTPALPGTTDSSDDMIDESNLDYESAESGVDNL